MCKIYFIEGPDYSGKTTLINKIKESFKDKRILVLREPCNEMRAMLLDKDRNLQNQTRRFLFAASHTKIMSEIYTKRKEYDIVIVDRSAVVSDIIYSNHENGVKEHMSKITGNTLAKIIDIYIETDNVFYNDFFKNNSELLMLTIDDETFEKRLKSRKIDEKDINDSRDDDFKWRIKRDYEIFITNSDTSRIIVPSIFKAIHVLKSDDDGTAFNEFCSILDGGNGNV